MTPLLLVLAAGLLTALVVRVIRANRKVTVRVQDGPVPCEFCGRVAADVLAIRRWRAGTPRTGYVYACPRHFGDAIERLKP